MVEEMTQNDSWLPKKKIAISSVDLRNGQQSLFATRFKTEDMLPILDEMDNVGFHHVEMWGGATFDVCLRFLGDDPWERLRLFKKHFVKTPLRMLMRGQSVLGYHHYPDDLVERFVFKAAECGMDIFLVFDGLNDVRNCETAIRAAKAAGKEAHGAILYTVSPVHDTEAFVKCAKEFEALGVSAIHLIDMAGQLTPVAAYTIVKALKETIHVPLHLKCHATGGQADMAYIEAIRAGVDAISTCFSAMANGISNPATEAMVAALKGTTADSGLDLDSLQNINNFFLGLREKYKEYLSRFTRVDVEVFKHQIPGGMISNLENQLKTMGVEDRLNEVFEEAQTVRRDLGYPPLATPFSQMVGAQATTNVLMGSRYEVVVNEVRDYVKGLYGKAPGHMDSKLVELVLNGEMPISDRPGSLLAPEYERRKAECREFARSEEDILTYALFPKAGKEFLLKKYGLDGSADM